MLTFELFSDMWNLEVLVLGDVADVADVITSGLKDCICIFPLFQNLWQNYFEIFLGNFASGHWPELKDLFSLCPVNRSPPSSSSIILAFKVFT